MKTNISWIECIQERVSVRTYEDKDINASDLQNLEQFIQEVNQTIDAKFDFRIIRNKSNSKDNQKLGTYGVIKGTSTFIAAILQNDEKDVVELGYQLEKIVLYATSIGLGSCWLGGTFNRKDFEDYLALNDNEALVILIAIGYKKEKRSLIESAMRLVANSNNRKPNNELFFNQNVETELDLNTIGDYAKVLEMVRIAPSASNKQPWRIVKADNYYHLYCCRTPGYGIMNYDLQLNDMGIAKCHFELSAYELNLKGHWIEINIPTKVLNWEYCITWETSV